MRRTVLGVAAVVTATSVFMLTGLGVAGAASTIVGSSPSATAEYSPAGEAATLRTLHDQLDAQWKAGDATAMRTTQADLAAELAKLRAGEGVHQAMTAATVSAVNQAMQQNAQLGAALAQVPDGSHGNSAADLPPVPSVGGLTALIQALLSTLLGVITGLLGGLPVPTPVG